jgi:hypothetical protein
MGVMVRYMQLCAALLTTQIRGATVREMHQTDATAHQLPPTPTPRARAARAALLALRALRGMSPAADEVAAVDDLMARVRTWSDEEAGK